MTEYNFCRLGLSVIETEAQAINALTQRINADFQHACEYLLNTQGRIVVLGMGKSGHIGGKIAATLASTGSPAFFVHPGEASHGDMGMITPQDTVIAISNSGNTAEINALLPLIKRLQIPLVAITGNPQSELAQQANVNLDVSVEREACPLGLAPTTSTTAALVMGDALAVALLDARGFTADDFALSHPGGTLGRRLLLHIDDVMQHGDEMPLVTTEATIRDALLEMTAKKLGMTCVVDKQGPLAGVFTDGDVRRTLDQNLDIHNTPITRIMSTTPKTIQRGLLAVEALSRMQEYKITTLVVIDEARHPVGVLHMHALINAGVI